MTSGAEEWLKRIWDRQEAQARRIRVKEWAAAHKGGRCVLCGYNRSLKAFDFHHLDPGEKDFDVSSRLTASLDVLKKELDKCILVCANCHREIHDGLHPSYLVTEDHLADDVDFSLPGDGS